MQKSYLVKSPVHFADFGFFVKIGDILVHDITNANRLTIYRNGEIVKAVKQTSLGIAAMLKSEFISEVTQQAPAKLKAAPKAAKAPEETFPCTNCAAGSHKKGEGCFAPKPKTQPKPKEEVKTAVVAKPEEKKPVAKATVKPEAVPEIEDETV